MEGDLTIIGIAGPRGSGKSFAAKVLKDEYEKRFPGKVQVVAFADSLKKFAARLCGLSDESATMDCTKELYVDIVATNLAPEMINEFFVCNADEIAKSFIERVHLIKTPCTFGRILQLLGTEVLRAADPGIFVRTVMNRERPDVRVLIIPDVRFENECDAITELGGRVFRINPVVKTADTTGRDAAHASERVLGCVEFVIENDYTPLFAERVVTWSRSVPIAGNLSERAASIQVANDAQAAYLQAMKDRGYDAVIMKLRIGLAEGGRDELEFVGGPFDPRIKNEAVFSNTDAECEFVYDRVRVFVKTDRHVVSNIIALVGGDGYSLKSAHEAGEFANRLATLDYADSASCFQLFLLV